MQNESFSFQATNATYLMAASMSTALPVLLGPRLEGWFGDIATVIVFLLVGLGIYLFIKAVRPITFTLLPEGLQYGEQHLTNTEIIHVELNERYRQIGLKTSAMKSTTYYYLKRKADLPYVSQALQKWAQETGISVQIKNSWRS